MPPLPKQFPPRLTTGPWRFGDVVKVVHHDYEARAIGMIFTIKGFSAMDYVGDHPITANPWYEPDRGLCTPQNLRFAPGDLVEADVLERMSVIR